MTANMDDRTLSVIPIGAATVATTVQFGSRSAFDRRRAQFRHSFSGGWLANANGDLLYWDFASNTIAQTIAVGRNPVGLTLGLVEPCGGVSTPPGGGTSAGGATGSAGGSSSTGSAMGGGAGAVVALAELGRPTVHKSRIKAPLRPYSVSVYDA